MKLLVALAGAALALGSTSVSAQNWRLAGADSKSKAYIDVSSIQKMGDRRVRYLYEMRFNAVQALRAGVRFNVSHMYEEADCGELSYGVLQVSASLDGKITLEPQTPNAGRAPAKPGSVAHGRIREVCRIAGLG